MRGLRLSIFTLLLLALAACGSGKSELATGPLPGAAPLLPSVAELRNLSASDGLELLRQGADYDQSLPSRRVAVAAPTSLTFSPAWQGGSGMQGLAYAGYAFGINAYGGALKFQFHWAAAPGEGLAWLAVADFAQQAWDWYLIDPLTGVDAGAFGPQYDNGAGQCFAEVLLTGTAAATLDTLRLGENLVPQPQLGVQPDPLEVGLQATLNGSASSDTDGSIVRYEFDPLGSGSFVDNGGVPLLLYTYDTAGTYQAALRVTDNEGASATAALSVTVNPHAGGLQPNLEVTPQRANPEDVLSFDASASICTAGTITKYEFDPKGDGNWIDNGLNPMLSYAYVAGGEFIAGLRIFDDQGNSALASHQVSIGWQHNLRGPAGSTIQVHAVRADSAGNVYVCGEGLNLNGSVTNKDGFVASYTPSGSLRWARLFTTGGLQTLNAIAFDSQGGMYVGGYSQWSIEDFAELELLRLNPATGNLLWRRQALGLWLPTADLVIDSSDRLTLLGEEVQGLGNHALAMLRCDTDGMLVWQKQLALDSVDLSLGGVAVDDSGNLYGCSSFYPYDNYDGLVYSLDVDGAKRWVDSFATTGDDLLLGLCASGSSFYVGGSTTFGGGGNGLLLRIDTWGDTSAVGTYDGGNSGSEKFFGLAPDGSDGVFISGTSTGSDGKLDALGLQLDSLGSLPLQGLYGSAGVNDNGDSHIMLDGSGALYLGGVVDQFNTSFTDLPGSFTLLNLGQYSYGTYYMDFVDGGYSFDNGSNDIVAWTAITADAGGAFIVKRY